MLHHFNYLDDIFKSVAFVISERYLTTGAMFETWEISARRNGREVGQLLRNHLISNKLEACLIFS